MVNGEGVVGSSRKWGETEDVFGAKPEKGVSHPLVSDMGQTKAMFVSMDKINEATGDERERRIKGFKENKVSLATYFLMPDDILMKAWLTKKEIDEVCHGLVQRDLALRKYVCSGKPYIPTGDISFLLT